MKSIQWKGYITIPATVIMPEEATHKEVCEALAEQIDENLTVLGHTFWDDVIGVEEIGVFEDK